MPLGEGAEARPSLEGCSLLGAPGGEALPVRRGDVGPEVFERLALPPPALVAVDDGVAEPGSRSRRQRGNRGAPSAWCLIDAQEEGAAPPAARGEVRTGRDRGGRRRCMQRTQGQEPRSELVQPRRQVAHVGEVTDAPAVARPGGGHLYDHAPGTEVLREVAPARSDEQRRHRDHHRGAQDRGARGEGRVADGRWCRGPHRPPASGDSGCAAPQPLRVARPTGVGLPRSDRPGATARPRCSPQRRAAIGRPCRPTRRRHPTHRWPRPISPRVRCPRARRRTLAGPPRRRARTTA